MSGLARRYAKALFEIAVEDHAVDRIAGDLDGLGEALRSSKELRDHLVSPAYATRLRRETLCAVADKLGTGEEVKNLAQLMIDRNRMELFAELTAMFRNMMDDARGQVRGAIETAQPLSDEQVKAIQAKLATMTGREVLLSVRERPELIGGIVARVGNTVFDASLKTRLDTLTRAMTEGARTMTEGGS